jgi:non-specific serine/threonine protein kinase
LPGIGSRIGPYEVLGRLGEGGMGEVFLARDTRLERDVALKMLPPTLARDSEQLDRFRREALTLASLNHPNIATIHGIEEGSDGSLALALERVEGATLAHRLSAGALAIEEALRVCAQIAEALEAAHERGIVHRDLKPGNVMLGPRGIVKVLDFGIAKNVAKPESTPPAAATSAAGGSARPAPSPAAVPLTEFGTVMGTPGYMSPEQAIGATHDARSDIFAFGCVLYECLAGRPVFGTSSVVQSIMAALHDAPDFGALPERLHPRVRVLLGRCLEKAPDRRLSSIRDARIELEDVLGIRRASAMREGAAAETPSNLPQPRLSFVGRERETEACERALERTRLLTLTGVGGGGKTRLAIHVAARRTALHPDGVWFADFAPLSDAASLVETLVVMLKLREEAGRSLADTLVAHLAPRRALVVLDNCEHLLDPCAALARRLLDACPELTLIATSREPLGLDGERVHAVATLALPGEAEIADPDALARNESARLFLDRAERARPGFAMRPAEARDLAEICRALDGIPLAIELAAARVRVLSVREIREKLGDRFRLLTGGSRGATPRQQTLRAALQWSWDQLAAPEQSLLRALSVFSGGWTLGTATAIAMDGGDEFEVLDLLTRLVDKSLVVASPVGAEGARYHLLETVRAYAREQLDAAGALAALRDRHLAYFLALGEAAGRELFGPDQARWLATLEAEHQNLLGAFAWSADTPDGPEQGLRLATSIYRFWSARGHYEIGRRTLGEALARPGGGAPSRSRANALVRAGGLALYQGDVVAARPLIEQSLAIYRSLEDSKGIARALNGLGTASIYGGDLSAARGFIDEATAIYRRLEERRGVAVSLHSLGFVELLAGDLEAAETAYRQAMEILLDLRDEESIAMLRADLGVVLVRLGRARESRAELAAAVEIASRLGAGREGACALEGLAELALATGAASEAARFLRAADGIRASIGTPPSPPERGQRDDLARRIGHAGGGTAGPVEGGSAGAGPLTAGLEIAKAWLSGQAAAADGTPKRELPH